MSEKKKPDYVVYDEETGTYNAALLPYSSGVAAPKITTPDITSWKQTNINKVNHEIKSQFDQLKAQYEAMVKKYEDNQLVYGAKFSFELITYTKEVKMDFPSYLSFLQKNVLGNL